MWSLLRQICSPNIYDLCLREYLFYWLHNYLLSCRCEPDYPLRKYTRSRQYLIIFVETVSLRNLNPLIECVKTDNFLSVWIWNLSYGFLLFNVARKYVSRCSWGQGNVNFVSWIVLLEFVGWSWLCFSHILVFLHEHLSFFDQMLGLCYAEFDLIFRICRWCLLE